MSDWRATLLMRRATSSLSPTERRWSNSPLSVFQVHPLLRQMERRGEIMSIPPLKNIYQVIVPYARSSAIEEYEILMEIHPYAALSHLSALAFHGLTDELPKVITTFIPTDGIGDLLPPGTTIDDWEGLALIRGRHPAQILGRPVRWTGTKLARYFGTYEYRPRGYPIRVTTAERTLLDGLLQPALSGGLTNVLKAWTAARDMLDLEALIAYVERFDINVLRQRVGFILEELTFTHAQLDRWQAHASRGGSSKLSASEPYAPTFNERWNLSLNAPTDVLREDLG
ncbi:MAG: type IV toxin-antitoxin system AbiEi family antitoxin domain-containing protein [Thermomicrobiales bacterium]